MKLKGFDIVVDIGSGDGYYSSRFAERCGKVVAVDSARDVFKGEYYSKDNVETVCENAWT
jgi:protein-L-isoaspartate O-methyltransferase